MTFKERYLMEHPDCDIETVMWKYCPQDFYVGSTKINSGKCTNTICKKCWERTPTKEENLISKFGTMVEDADAMRFVEIEQAVNKILNREADQEPQKSLKEYTTKDLVEELKQREGVSSNHIGQYQRKDVSVNGPAEILVIID